MGTGFDGYGHRLPVTFPNTMSMTVSSSSFSVYSSLDYTNSGSDWTGMFNSHLCRLCILMDLSDASSMLTLSKGRMNELTNQKQDNMIRAV